MTNCQNIKADLSAFIDGELPAARQADIRAHLDGCPTCRQQLAEMSQLMAGIGALPQVQPAPQFLADVRRKIKASEPVGHSWRATLFFPVWPKVALEAFALLVAIAGILFVTRSASNQPTVKVALLPKTESAAPTEPVRRRVQILTDERAPEVVPAPVPAAPAESEITADRSGGFVAQADKDVSAKVRRDQDTEALEGGAAGLLKQTSPSAARPEPPQIVIMTGESLVAVKLRAETVALSLSGRVDSASASNKLMVSLPQSKVSTFRKRMAKAGTRVPSTSPDYAKWAATPAAPMPPTGSAVVTNMPPAGTVPGSKKDLASTNQTSVPLVENKASSTESKEPVVELEIVVEPANKPVGK